MLQTALVSATKSSIKYDVAVVGGGIIGTSIARGIKEKYPGSSVVILEKEKSLGKHQSSHNSGVVHSGIYYEPGTLKAKLCIEGQKLAYNYCDQKNIPYKKCGKLVVAATDREVTNLHAVYKRALQCNLENVTLLRNEGEIKKIEPNCVGRQALWCPDTGNVDWELFTINLSRDFRKSRGEIRFNYKVETIERSMDADYPIIVNSAKDRISAKYLIKAGGLHSEELTELNSSTGNCKIVSFLVEYKKLTPKKRNMISTNVYSIPNLPFLGPHLSPTMDGNVLVGPSAVPAAAREGYTPTTVDFPYVRDLLASGGFRKMAVRNGGECLRQFSKTVCNNLQARELSRMVPFLEDGDVVCGPSAVQAQAVDDDGCFVHDYMVEVFEGEGIEKRIVDCKFVPSPGATSCLALAGMVVDKFPVGAFS